MVGKKCRPFEKMKLLFCSRPFWSIDREWRAWQEMSSVPDRWGWTVETPPAGSDRLASPTTNNNKSHILGLQFELLSLWNYWSRSSVGDPWHFGADPDHRIRTSD